jgi:hypothetical protein
MSQRINLLLKLPYGRCLGLPRERFEDDLLLQFLYENNHQGPAVADRHIDVDKDKPLKPTWVDLSHLRLM